MMQPACDFQSGPWHGQVRQDWHETLADLDAWLAANPGELVVKYESREVRRIATPRGTVYLKRILALTDAGLHWRDWLSALKWYCRPSRALACWKISRQMLESGFACCEPLLAVRRRHAWGRPEDILLTAEVSEPDLRESLPLLSPDALHEAVRTASRQLRTFHEAGFVHGDCLLRNLCLSAEGKLIFLDNDRTKRPAFWNIFCRKSRNLAQFGYSLRRCLPDHPELLPLFFDAYFGDRRPEGQIRRLTTAIETRLAKRLARKPS